MKIVTDSYGSTLKAGVFLGTDATALDNTWGFPDDPPGGITLLVATGKAVLPVFLYVRGLTLGGTATPWYSFLDIAELTWSFAGVSSTQFITRAGSAIQPSGALSFTTPQDIQLLTYDDPVSNTWLDLPPGTYVFNASWTAWGDVDYPTTPTVHLTATETVVVTENSISPGPFWPPYSATETNGPKALNFVRSKK